MSRCFVARLQDASEEDLQCARRLYKARSLLAAELDWRIVRRLFKKGLVYLDVPIRETDHVVGALARAAGWLALGPCTEPSPPPPIPHPPYRRSATPGGLCDEPRPG